MSIRVKCSCGDVLSAPDDLAGKQVRCPSCGEVVRVPEEGDDADAGAGLGYGIVARPESAPAEEPGHLRLSDEQTADESERTKNPAVLLIALVGLILVGAGVYLQLSKGRGGPDAFKYIPADCNMLMVVDVESIMKVPEVTENLKALEGKAELDVARQLGFGPGDMLQVYVGADASKAGPGRFPGVALLTTRAPVNLDEAITAAGTKDKETKITKETTEGRTVYRVSKPGKPEVLVAQFDEHLVGVGDPVMMTASLQLANGTGKSVLTNGPLMSLCKRARKTDMVWMAMLMDEAMKAKAASVPGNMAATVGKVKGMVLSATYSGDLDLNGVIVCKDSDTAEQFVSQANMFKGMATANPKSGMTPRDIRFEATGGAVTFSVHIPEAVLERLGKQFGGMADKLKPPMPMTPSAKPRLKPKSLAPAK